MSVPLPRWSRRTGAENPKLREDLIHRGLARARAFSRKRTARETWDVVVEVSKENSAPAAPKTSPNSESPADPKDAAKKRRIGDLIKIGISLSLMAFLIS